MASPQRTFLTLSLGPFYDLVKHWPRHRLTAQSKWGFILAENGTCPSTYHPQGALCQHPVARAKMREEFEANRREGFIPTLITVGPAFVAGFATLITAGLAAPFLTTSLAAAKVAGTAALKIGTSIVAARPQAAALSGGGTVGLNLGGLLSGIGGALGGITSVPALQSLGQITSAFAPAFATGPQTIAGPVFSPPPSFPQPQGQPVMGMVPAIAVGAGAIARLTAPILFKVAQKLGKRVSLTSTIAMIRKMGKFLLDPAAIAIALGITIGELATLITAHSSKKARHMNAANGKALRRAARRIKSFHRMCGSIDLLKSRGRRRPSSSTFCATCRKNPCRC